MANLIKSLFELITSFFANSTATKKKEVVLAEVTEKAVVEEIRATTNAVVVEQVVKTAKAVAKVRKTAQKRKAASSKKPLDEQLDDQFSQDQ